MSHMQRCLKRQRIIQHFLWVPIEGASCLPADLWEIHLLGVKTLRSYLITTEKPSLSLLRKKWPVIYLGMAIEAMEADKISEMCKKESSLRTDLYGTPSHKE